MSEPVRTCVGCRERSSKASLVRVIAVDGVAVTDITAQLPGRGAYLHPRAECAQRALRKKAFGRALRSNGMLDTAALAEAITELETAKIKSGPDSNSHTAGAVGMNLR